MVRVRSVVPGGPAPLSSTGPGNQHPTEPDNQDPAMRSRLLRNRP